VRPPFRALLVVAAAFLASTRHAAAAQGTRPLQDAIELLPGRTCLDEKRLESHVRAWLGTDRIDTEIRIVVQGDALRPNAAEFRITRGAKVRVRRFEATPTGCEEAHAAIGLAIALAIDGGVLRRVAQLAPAEPPFRRFTLQGGVAFDVLPSLSFGGRAGFEHELLDWLTGLFELSGQYSPDNVIAGVSGSFSATLLTAGARVCAGRPVSEALEFTLCGGAAAGAIHAQGSGYTTTRSSTGFWGGVQTGIRADVKLGIRWVTDLELVVPFYSPPFRVDRGGAEDAVRRPQPAGIAVHFGPSFEF
jgi:hypothetical protein